MREKSEKIGTCFEAENVIVADELLLLDEPPDELEDEAAQRPLLVLCELIEPAHAVNPTLPEQALGQDD